MRVRNLVKLLSVGVIALIMAGCGGGGGGGSTPPVPAPPIEPVESMMEKGIIYPTLNLDNVSPDCQGINHVMEAVSKDISIMVKNCFAFGGINSVLVCKKL